MLTIALLILGGVVISLAIGSVWHMPNTPGGKVHMRAIGFDVLSPEEQQQRMEEGKKGMPKIFAAQALLSALMSVAVVMIMYTSLTNGVAAIEAAGFVAINWLCFMVPVIGGNILWENYPKDIVWKKFLSDILYNLVTLVLIAGLVALFI